MKKTIAIAVVVIILMVALALSVLWAVDVVNSLGANGTQDTIGTTEVVSPETPGVTDASYFNFTAKTMQNDNKETVTYYTVSAKSVGIQRGENNQDRERSCHSASQLCNLLRRFQAS